MDAERVNLWLERTEDWISDRGGQQNDGSIQHRSELRVFLADLHRQLVEWGSLGIALRSSPINIAQLLGRLCSNPALMAQEDDCRLIMQCVMKLYTSTPCNSTEEKAAKWAQSQIRHCISYYKEKNLCVGVAESVGCSASHFNHTSTLKFLESMVEDLYKVPETRWDSSANCLVPSTQLSSATLNHLSELCMPLVTSGTSAIVPLVECLLSCHGNTAEDALSPAFLKAITETQQNAYTDKNNALKLTYKGRVSLWTRYLPALESEFLNLVHALIAKYPSTEIDSKQLISSRQLPLACVENPSVNTAIQSLMELLLQNTEGSSSFVLNLMEVFSKCVQESRKAVKTAEFHCRVTRMDGLCNQLQVNPRDLSLSLLALHINNISNFLMQMVPDDHAGRLQVWLLLVRSPGWHHAAVGMLLHGSAESRPACLNIVAGYNMPLVPNQHQQYKAQLSDLVISLRGLCSKTSVQSCDLHCAFNPLHGAEVKGCHMRNVIHPLMMLFVVNGRGTLQLLADIVKLDMGDKELSAATSFMFLLESVEFSIMWDATSQLRPGNRRQHVNEALQECKGAYLAEYQQRRRSGETVSLTEKQHSNLLGQYERIVKLVM